MKKARILIGPRKWTTILKFSTEGTCNFQQRGQRTVEKETSDLIELKTELEIKKIILQKRNKKRKKRVQLVGATKEGAGCGDNFFDGT